MKNRLILCFFCVFLLSSQVGADIPPYDVAASEASCTKTVTLKAEGLSPYDLLNGPNCTRQLVSITVVNFAALGIVDFSWFRNESRILPNTQEVRLFEVDEGLVNIRFEGTGANGCLYVGLLQIDFMVCGCLCENTIFPAKFSPNGDGQNDKFGIFWARTCDLLDYRLRVFNRWGHLVFETFDPQVRWDGSVNGNNAPSDVFIYYSSFTIGYDECEKQGEVTIVR